MSSENSPDIRIIFWPILSGLCGYTFKKIPKNPPKIRIYSELLLGPEYTWQKPTRLPQPRLH